MKKAYVYNNKMIKGSLLAIIIVPLTLLTGCVDTHIVPASLTVEEDFWKTKSDVSLMVANAYKAMVASNCIADFIVWGEMRSDDINTTSDITISTSTENDLTEINIAGIETDNIFCNWYYLYYVINSCNIVLDHAEAVMSIDPNYTEGDYQVDRSQMLALRSLCYFYLVRAFRDVPYSAVAYINSSQTLISPQSAPDSVLQCCVNDLEEAASAPLYADSYNDWRRVGLFTYDGIESLLADIWLWRAAMAHNSTYYEYAVEACDKVIASKKDQHIPGRFEVVDESQQYFLADADDYFNDIFVEGNAEESIFELQLDGSNNVNSSVATYYNSYNGSVTHGLVQASSLFKTYSPAGDAANANYIFATYNDLRYWNSTYKVGDGTKTAFDIRKMVTQSANKFTSTNVTSSSSGATKETRANSNYKQNWIVYRLTDVMLMKAEALVELAESDEDEVLQQAFDLVNTVYKRALAAETDSLEYDDYEGISNMELLVLKERQRELCYEGKRWYDLVRYNYRHVNGTDATRTMAEIIADGEDLPSCNKTFLSFIATKYTEGSSGVTYRIDEESAIYFPIYENELKVNELLVQNPSYSSNDVYEKNY